MPTVIRIKSSKIQQKRLRAVTKVYARYFNMKAKHISWKTLEETAKPTR